jgi:hypothetical protein
VLGGPIFVSYARINAAYVRRLVTWLARAGVRRVDGRRDPDWPALRGVRSR